MAWRRDSFASLAIVVCAGAALASCSTGDSADLHSPATSTTMHASRVALRPPPLDYTPPPESAIARSAQGDSIRHGLALVTRTHDSLPGYARNSLQCSSCHLDAGRRRNAAALLGVAARYPTTMARTASRVDIEVRVNFCLTRSLAGNALPPQSGAMRHIVAYLRWLSSGVPAGAHVQGEGIPTIGQLTGDTIRGAALFASTCAACHGAQGQGTPPTIPALWGSMSYSIAASMAREERAASFIQRFMPVSNPGSLTAQQAFDVAAYVNSHPRPDSPRKVEDWPAGGAPYDVPYDTRGHAAYRPPVRLLARATSSPHHTR